MTDMMERVEAILHQEEEEVVCEREGERERRGK